MVSVPFPPSSTPGRRAGEGEGRLINAFSEKAGQTVYIRRVPGLATFANVGTSNPRGLIDYNGTLFGVFGSSVKMIATDGTVTTLSGTMPGTGLVTLARNNFLLDGAPSPHLVAVSESGGARWISAPTVLAYPDADLPATVNSVAFMDGYFLFTLPDGRIFASGLNATDVDALSFATAEGQPDGLLRGIVHGGVFYAMGTSTIEPWLNTGGSPFPLSRGTSVIPVGLLAASAVAGFGEGWDHEPLFVAHDGTVRALQGYQAPKVSTPDVESFIASSTVSALEACVYTAGGNAFWSLSSNAGTWEYNVITGLWHERVSTGSARWRGSRSVKANGQWFVGDKLANNLLTVSTAVRTEAGSAVTWTIESSPLKNYPTRVQVPAVFGDFTQATGVSVSVSWSHDGGQTWDGPIIRTLDNVDAAPVRVNRLGLSTQHGLRVRFTSSSSGDFSFMGASVPDVEARKP